MPTFAFTNERKVVPTSETVHSSKCTLVIFVLQTPKCKHSIVDIRANIHKIAYLAFTCYNTQSFRDGFSEEKKLCPEISESEFESQPDPSKA